VRGSVGFKARALAAQGGVCAVCRRPLVVEAAILDHDHLTGNDRGILCGRCNSGLGFFGDQVEGLERAIGYLTAPPLAEDDTAAFLERTRAITQAIEDRIG
jgi:hypothetical protein